jgi:hypothetical protein
MAWWYVCIGVGFSLLGARAFLDRAPTWTAVLRWVIAAGFLALGIGELRSIRSNSRRRS